MSKIDFYNLPFNERPDLTPYLVHLTRSSKTRSAFSNLKKILKDGKISGSGSSGFIKGPDTASCFMDIPFSSLKHVVTRKEDSEEYDRYEPYGIIIRKTLLYKRGGRPVLYLSDEEIKSMSIQDKDLWKVVRFECSDDNKWISWLHEREWRLKGDFKLPNNQFGLGIIVKSPREVAKLNKYLKDNVTKLKYKPEVIIPLDVVCQGLIY